MFTRLPHYEDAPTHPIAVTMHENSKTLCNHYLFLCDVQPSLWPSSHIIRAHRKAHFLSLVPLSLHSHLSTQVFSLWELLVHSWFLWTWCCFAHSVTLVCLSREVSEISWYLSFSTWLISLCIIPSSSIHVVVNGRIFSFVMSE